MTVGKAVVDRFGARQTFTTSGIYLTFASIFSLWPHRAFHGLCTEDGLLSFLLRTWDSVKDDLAGMIGSADSAPSFTSGSRFSSMSRAHCFTGRSRRARCRLSGSTEPITWQKIPAL